jgi:hypothetical protein
MEFKSLYPKIAAFHLQHRALDSTRSYPIASRIFLRFSSTSALRDGALPLSQEQNTLEGAHVTFLPSHERNGIFEDRNKGDKGHYLPEIQQFIGIGFNPGLCTSSPLWYTVYNWSSSFHVGQIQALGFRSLAVEGSPARAFL